MRIVTCFLSFLFVFGTLQASEVVYQESYTNKNLGLYSSYMYPASGEQMVHDLKSEKVLIFAYGSLLNIESAERTLSREALKSYKPAVAFGVRRIFNYNVNPESIKKRYGQPTRPNDTAALNIFSTGDYSDVVNGVVFCVNQEDLEEMIQREVGYDLIPVPVVFWDEFVNHSVRGTRVMIAYAFRASLDKYMDVAINPIPGYAHVSMEGASQHGSDFLELWIETTYLSDGKTPFRKWEENKLLNCTLLGCS